MDPSDLSDPGGSGERAAVTEGPPAPPAPVPDPTAALEALLFVSDAPLSTAVLAAALDLTPASTAGLLDRLRRTLDATGRGVELREVAGGWRLTTRLELDPVVTRLLVGGQQARLTQAALETLAVIAYRQPVTRGRVAAVRGVGVDGVVRTLLARGLVEEAGPDPDSGAVTYRTTGYFLERLGLRSLDELPSLAPLLPDIGEIDDQPD